MTSPIPEGFSSVTPSLIFKDCAKAIETYKKAFGAKEIARVEMPDGSKKIMHAVIEIGNSKIMMADEFPNCPATTSSNFYVYMPDCDVVMTQAKKAGLTETMPAEDMFWGDRLGSLKDENGLQWTIATHVIDPSNEEIEKGAKEMAERMKNASKQAA